MPSYRREAAGASSPGAPHEALLATHGVAHAMVSGFSPPPSPAGGSLASSTGHGHQRIETFPTDLAVRGYAAASTHNQALNALVLLFRDVLRREIAGLDAVRARSPTCVKSKGLTPLSCSQRRSAASFSQNPCRNARHDLVALGKARRTSAPVARWHHPHAPLCDTTLVNHTAAQ
jgi:hypothetical protein